MGVRRAIALIASVVAAALFGLLPPGRAQGAQPLTLKVESYSGPTAPPLVCIPQVKTPPTLDGKLDDAAWKQAAVIDRLVSTTGDKVELQTKVYLAFDDANLYVAFDCQEPEMDRVTVLAEEGQDKWPGDAVEVFIDVNRTRTHYYQFVTNNRGAHNDYMDGGTWWNGDWKCEAGRTAAGWCVEYAIPFAGFELDKAPRDGTWGLNVTRQRSVAQRQDKAKANTLSTWAPMLSFGNPDLFGAAFFGPAERHKSVAQPIKLEGTLDKFVYTKDHPVAHLALRTASGEPQGAKVGVRIERVSDGTVMGEATLPTSGTIMGVDVPIEQLPADRYQLRTFALNRADQLNGGPLLPFDIRTAAQTNKSGEVTIRRSQPMAKAIDRWHVRTGVPFPEHGLTDAGRVALFTSDGKPVTVQSRTLATWSKHGSVKWLGLDFQLPLSATGSETLTLRYGPDVRANQGGEISVVESEATLLVKTGVAKFEIKRDRFNFINQMWVGERQLIAADGRGRGPYMADERGERFWGCLDPAGQVKVVESNPMRAVVRAEGWHVNERGLKLGRYVTHLYFYSGVPYFRAQHTFIIAEDTDQTRYSDIGLLLPVAGEEYRLGVNDGTLAGNASVSLLQKRWDQYAVRTDRGVELKAGDQAPGTLARGDLAVVMRDFWQNFPKELEATRDALVVHFWPAHGERVWSEQEEIQVEHAYMLPFVHQGKLLDFKVPAPYFTGPLAQENGFSVPDGKGGWALGNGAGAQRANAMGVGKTHDILIAFGDAAQPEPLAALREAFQTDVHFLPDPNWTCETRVVGDMSPVDRERFPKQESYLNDGFDFLMNWTLDLSHAYGMFNYGDSFTSAKRDTPNVAPSYYRLWGGLHHGRPRVPWLLYLRSGDPKYFAWARANTQRTMDVSICHHDTPEFRAAHGAARKSVGGMTDYKGYVPWHSGDRVGDYNNLIDYMLLDYYLTGNRRAIDVADEVGQLLIQHAKGHTSREGSNLGALLDYYQHTWNAAALMKFTSELPKTYAKPAVEHDPPSVQWAPFLEPWIIFSGDKRATAFLLALADDLLDAEKGPINSQHYGDGRPLATAYTLTNNPEYLYHAWGFYNRGPGLYDNPKDQRHHFVDWLDFSYDTQHMLPVMTHLRRMPQMPTLAQAHYAGGGHLAFDRGGKTAEMRAVVTETKDGEFWIGSRRFFARKECQYELTNPAGRVVQSGVVPASSEGTERFKILQMRDGLEGDYTLRVWSADEFISSTTLISSLGTDRFLMPDKEAARLTISGRYFIFVPADCERFRYTLEPVPNTMASLAVITPDDRIHVKRSLGSTDGESVVVEVQPPAQWRGKVWSLSATGCRVTKVEGVPPWFAATYRGAEQQVKREAAVAAAP